MRVIKFRVWGKSKKLIEWDKLKESKNTLGLLLTSKVFQSDSVITQEI